MATQDKGAPSGAPAADRLTGGRATIYRVDILGAIKTEVASFTSIRSRYFDGFQLNITFQKPSGAKFHLDPIKDKQRALIIEGWGHPDVRDPQRHDAQREAATNAMLDDHITKSGAKILLDFRSESGA